MVFITFDNSVLQLFHGSIVYGTINLHGCPNFLVLVAVLTIASNGSVSMIQSNLTEMYNYIIFVTELDSFELISLSVFDLNFRLVNSTMILTGSFNKNYHLK